MRARPAQPTPASHPQRAHGPASGPASPARSSARLRSLLPWPRASAARRSPARLPASPAAAANGPRLSALLCFFPTPRSNHRATEPRQQWQGGPGGHARGMPLSPCATPTQPHAHRWMQACASDHPSASIRRSPSSMAELGYKTPAPEP